MHPEGCHCWTPSRGGKPGAWPARKGQPSGPVGGPVPALRGSASEEASATPPCGVWAISTALPTGSCLPPSPPAGGFLFWGPSRGLLGGSRGISRGVVVDYHPPISRVLLPVTEAGKMPSWTLSGGWGWSSPKAGWWPPPGPPRGSGGLGLGHPPLGGLGLNADLTTPQGVGGKQICGFVLSSSSLLLLSPRGEEGTPRENPGGGRTWA